MRRSGDRLGALRQQLAESKRQRIEAEQQAVDLVEHLTEAQERIRVLEAELDRRAGGRRRSPARKR